MGTAITGIGNISPGSKAVTVSGVLNDEKILLEVNSGEIKYLPVPEQVVGEIDIIPAKGVDIGNGAGKKTKATIVGGSIGLVIDMRLCCEQENNPLIQAKHLISIGAYNEADIQEARRLADEVS